MKKNNIMLEVLEGKHSLEKSLLGGLLIGFCCVYAGTIQGEFIKSIIISLGFLSTLELKFPVFTLVSGEARIMTTFLGYPSPDVIMYRILIRKVLFGNILGLLLAGLCGIYLLPPDIITANVVDPSWGNVIVSSIVAGILINLGVSGYSESSNLRWIAVFPIFIVCTLGLSHSIVDLIPIMISTVLGDLSVLKGLGVLGLTILGNFFGTRVRTLIIKKDD